jgi:ankyrin repeat protein
VQVYNCILRRFPADTYALFDQGSNRYATTIFVLVSAVQKVSRCTRIPEGTLLYRGLGGLIDLPDNFHKADEQGRSGFLDWGMMSTSSDRDVALGYSGVKLRRPRAIVMVIEATAVDRGADVSDFSQYPGEKEFLWLPCSFVQRAQQTGGGRVQVVDGGLVTFVPVRVNLNLKTETVEELLEKKKSMHVTGFEFRVNELRQRLQDEARVGNAEARVKRDKDDHGMHWEKEHSVESFIEAQVKKVEAVMERHRAIAAADYSDDAVYRSLVEESLEVASMAQSALQLWLRNVLWSIHKLEEKPLLECHRNLETFLRRRYACAATEEQRRAAAVELCKARHLMSLDANEMDGNGESPLMALAARGGSGEDVALLVSAGADFMAVEASNRCAMHFAAQQGHVEAINSLVRVGANCNQVRSDRVFDDCDQVTSVTDKGETPIWRACANGHLGSVKALCEAGADVNQAAMHDGSTPLFMACRMGHCSVVEALLAWGADVNRANTVDSCTPVLIASRFGYSAIVRALLAAGGDVSKTLTSGPNKGASPVWAAAFSGRSECLQQLLAAGCDINACTDDGRSPVDIATANGHADMVQKLLSAGATQSSRAAMGFQGPPVQNFLFRM